MHKIRDAVEWGLCGPIIFDRLFNALFPHRYQSIDACIEALHELYQQAYKQGDGELASTLWVIICALESVIYTDG